MNSQKRVLFLGTRQAAMNRLLIDYLLSREGVLDIVIQDTESKSYREEPSIKNIFQYELDCKSSNGNWHDTIRKIDLAGYDELVFFYDKPFSRESNELLRIILPMRKRSTIYFFFTGYSLGNLLNPFRRPTLYTERIGPLEGAALYEWTTIRAMLIKIRHLIKRVLQLGMHLFGVLFIFVYFGIICVLYIKGLFVRSRPSQGINERIFNKLLSGRFLLRPHNAASKTNELNLFRHINCGPIALELGAGEGTFSEVLQGYLKIDFGSDYLADNATVLRKKNVFRTCLQVDATKIPFRDNSLTTIIFVHGLDHIDDKGGVLKEVSRVLHTDGSFAFSDVSEYWDKNLLSGFFSKTGLHELAKKYMRYRRRASLIEEPLSIVQYKELLQEYGLIMEGISYFDNSKLHNIRAFMRLIDLELWPMTHGWLRIIESFVRRRVVLQRIYRHIVSKAFLPMIRDDQRLCECETGGNLFICAKPEQGQ